MKNLKLSKRFGARLLLIGVFLLTLVAGITSPVAAEFESESGAVYTLTNAPAGNEVLVYNRSSHGSLALQGSYATNGLGSGASSGVTKRRRPQPRQPFSLRSQRRQQPDFVFCRKRKEIEACGCC